MSDSPRPSRINWPATLAEVGLILVGLLLAFAIDRAWENRHERDLEADYISRLHADFRATRSSLEAAIAHQEVVLDAGARILEAIAAQNIAELSAVLPTELPTALDWRSPAFVTATYDEMEAAGALGLIRDTDLRVALAEFDAHRTQVVPIGEGAVLDEWTHRVRPLLGSTLTTDVYMFEASRDSLDVPRAPFDPDYVRISQDAEFWNLIAHRLILEEHRLRDHRTALQMVEVLLNMTAG